MKSVGILTIHHSVNYGASLQSFALFHFLKERGYDVKVIDLYRPIYKGYIESKKYKPYFTIKKTLINRIKNIIRPLLLTKSKNWKKESRTAMERFNEFNSMVILSKPYKSIDSLYSNPPLYDTYISGSDQIWNPSQPYCLEPYFLTFAPKGARRISYSSSIGLTELPEIAKKDFAQWLSMYDAISVRESQGKKIIEELLCKNIEQMPDPTFLLTREQWTKLAVIPNQDEKYICLFCLKSYDKLCRLADRMAREMGIKLIVLGHFKRLLAEDIRCEYVYDAGPREFLGYIAKASCVFTDSFHGTVFSILMGARNFYSYRPDENPSALKRFSRIEDLLETFRLSDHIISGTDDFNIADLYDRVVDYDSVLRILDSESQRGQQYLLNNI